MNKSIIIFFRLFIIAVLFFSCTKNETQIPSITDGDGDDRVVTLSAFIDNGSTNNTKTSLVDGSKVSWSKGDVISYYSSNGGDVSSQEILEDTETVTLNAKVGKDDTYLIAKCGGGSISDQKGSSFTLSNAILPEQNGVFSDNHVAVGKVYLDESNQLAFKNITSFIKFSISRDDIKSVIFSSLSDGLIHSNGSIRIKYDGLNVSAELLEEGGKSIKVSSLSKGTFYIAMLPVTLPNGFIISGFDSDGNYLGSSSYRNELTLSSNTIIDIGSIDSKIVLPEKTPIQMTEAANCYVKKPNTSFGINATYKGKSDVLIGGDPYAAVVLWESYMTDESINKNDLIKSISLETPTSILVTTGEREGNALVGLVNRDGDVLWSWHIWITNADISTAYNTYPQTSRKVMDRNLGALSNKPGDTKAIGLYYQWGRKDPFVGGYTLEGSSRAATSIAWPNGVASDSFYGTIEYSVANPTTYIDGNDKNHDWLFTDSSTVDETRWTEHTSAKSMYDPCPAGWRIPDSTTSGLWSSSNFPSTYTSDTVNHGMLFGPEISGGYDWYPFCAYYTSLDAVGIYGNYWSASPCTKIGKKYCASAFIIHMNNNVNLEAYDYRSSAYNVRCVAE